MASSSGTRGLVEKEIVEKSEANVFWQFLVEGTVV